MRADATARRRQRTRTDDEPEPRSSPRSSRPSSCGSRSTRSASAGKPGEQIQNVISVGMLSEGWDAKTVTHIMGLRAFTSQLLCEQVVGRGLRRTSYELNPETGLFEPEYVNIFGVPFTFLPHEGRRRRHPPPPPTPKTRDRAGFRRRRSSRSRWPNVIRIDHVYRPRLSLDWTKVKPLELNASQTAKLAELAPILDGKPDVTKIAADRPRAAGARVPHAEDHLRGGARRLRPDAAGLEGQQGGAAGPARPAGRAVHPLGPDRDYSRRSSTRTTSSAA